MITERRTRRSDQMATALSYQLQACAERAGLDAMILSDSDGFLVAGSKTELQDTDEMAAMLPLITEGRDFAGILVTEREGSQAVHIRPFRADTENLWICAVGRAGETVSEQIDQAIGGVRRILA